MNAIVTGSSKGLGYALSECFLKNNFNVAISSRDKNGLNNAMSKLSIYKGKLFGQVVDFGKRESVEKYFDELLENWNRIDILVNNVGIYAEDRIDDDLEINLEKMLNVNLMSSVRMNHKVLKLMKKQRKGYIINVISIAANSPRHDAASYSISKIALKAYNDLLRESLKEFGIKVIALYPGPMNTSSWDHTEVDTSNHIHMSDMNSLIMNALSMSENTNIEEIVINTVSKI